MPGAAAPYRVLLMVTGGIAAYKACFLARLLKQAGFSVRVAMTEAAMLSLMQMVRKISAASFSCSIPSCISHTCIFLLS